MRNLWQVFVVVAAAALTMPGYAKPGHGNGSGHGHGGGNGHGNGGNGNGGNGHGNGNGGQNGGGNGNGSGGQHGNGNGHGKPTGGSTSTTLIGSIVCSDTRVLDLTGDYVLSSTLTGDTSSSLALSIVQDGRGRLVASTVITLADGTTTEVTLSGHLQLTAQSNLWFILNAGSDDEADENDLDDEDTSDTAATTSTTLSVHVVGKWNGTSFDTIVTADINGVVSEFGGTITPVNPLRGFTIEDTTHTASLHGPTRSVRSVTLPWGTISITAQEKTGKKGFTFMAHSGDFGVDIRGTSSSDGVSVSRAQVHLGYGSLRPDLSSLTVLPAVQ